MGEPTNGCALHRPQPGTNRRANRQANRSADGFPNACTMGITDRIPHRSSDLDTNRGANHTYTDHLPADSFAHLRTNSCAFRRTVFSTDRCSDWTAGGPSPRAFVTCESAVGCEVGDSEEVGGREKGRYPECGQCQDSCAISSKRRLGTYGLLSLNHG